MFFRVCQLTINKVLISAEKLWIMFFTKNFHFSDVACAQLYIEVKYYIYWTSPVEHQDLSICDRY